MNEKELKINKNKIINKKQNIVNEEILMRNEIIEKNRRFFKEFKINLNETYDDSILIDVLTINWKSYKQ